MNKLATRFAPLAATMSLLTGCGGPNHFTSEQTAAIKIEALEDGFDYTNKMFEQGPGGIFNEFDKDRAVGVLVLGNCVLYNTVAQVEYDYDGDINGVGPYTLHLYSNSTTLGEVTVDNAEDFINSYPDVASSC